MPTKDPKIRKAIKERFWARLRNDPIRLKEYKDSNHRSYIRHRKARNQRRSEVRTWVIEYKATLKCELCPESRHWCLDFHHKDPSKKDWSISDSLRHARTIEAVKRELIKCQVLCANCHRDLHYVKTS
jgi:hypothetical protein